MKGTPRVNILISTFNGRAYLREQLDSILSQSYPSITVTARDDGSSDGSEELLRSYAKANGAIRVISGPRVGVPGSYFELIRLADQDAQFYGFADQDDVWHPDKVKRAVEILCKDEVTKPLLYFSRVEYVDAKLHHLGYSRIPNEIGFHNALVENVAAGCTTVFNRKAVELLGHGRPLRARVHDHWMYLLATGFGRVVYDPLPLLKYRQHRENLIGGSNSARRTTAARSTRFIRQGRQFLGYFEQAAEFHRIYGDRLPFAEKEILWGFLASKESLLSRVRYALRMRVRRQSTLDNSLLRLLIVLGAY